MPDVENERIYQRHDQWVVLGFPNPEVSIQVLYPSALRSFKV